MLAGVELGDAVRRRRMVRRYDPHRLVPPGMVRQLLEFAIRAPSAGFSQGWDFVVLQDPDDRARFWTATTAPDIGADAAPDSDPHAEPDHWLRGMQSAPVLVLCLSDPGRYLDRYAEPDKGWADRSLTRWPVPYWDVDTGMAALLILLGSVDAGLGGCFFGVPADRHAEVRETFGIPNDRRIVGVVSLGYPAPGDGQRGSSSLRRGRRPVDEVAHQGRFGVRPSGT